MAFDNSNRLCSVWSACASAHSRSHAPVYMACVSVRVCGGITAVRLGGCRCSTLCLINNPRTAHQRPTRTPTLTTLARRTRARACAKCPGSGMACANVKRVADMHVRRRARAAELRDARGDVRRINGRVIAWNGENRQFGGLRFFCVPTVNVPPKTRAVISNCYFV